MINEQIAKVRGQRERSRFLNTSLLLQLYVTKVWVDIAITHMTLWSSRSFPTLERDWEESSRGKAAKSSTEHQPERGGIQRPSDQTDLNRRLRLDLKGGGRPSPKGEADLWDPQGGRPKVQGARPVPEASGAPSWRRVFPSVLESSFVCVRAKFIFLFRSFRSFQILQTICPF